MLPSGSGGVRRFPLRGAQPSTPPREAHSTRSALEREFNPAEADCGLQGTANSPSSTVKRKTTGGGAGIRTRGTGVTRARHFQCRTFGRSVTPPQCLAHRDFAIVWKILAEGRGFEPPRDLLGPYPISSRTPSTGLGHPSALFAERLYHVTRHATMLRPERRPGSNAARRKSAAVVPAGGQAPADSLPAAQPRRDPPEHHGRSAAHEPALLHRSLLARSLTRRLLIEPSIV